MSTQTQTGRSEGEWCKERIFFSVSEQPSNNPINRIPLFLSEEECVVIEQTLTLPELISLFTLFL